MWLIVGKSEQQRYINKKQSDAGESNVAQQQLRIFSCLTVLYLIEENWSEVYFSGRLDQKRWVASHSFTIYIWLVVYVGFINGVL